MVSARRGINADKIQWTDVATQYLRDNWDRMSASQIARGIGTGHTRNAIVGKADRLGLSTKEQNPKLGRPIRQARVVRPPQEVRIDVPGYQCHTVLDIIMLEPHQCRWPLDAGGFCGSNKYRGPHHKDTSYCLTHMKASINPHHYRGGYWSTRK